MSVDEVDDFRRSTSYVRPWRIPNLEFTTRYGRRSRAIVDADGAVVVLLDPSVGEYAAACTEEAADIIVSIVNGVAP